MNHLKKIVLIRTIEKSREKIYQDDEMMEKVGESMKELSEEFDKRLFYNHEEFKNMIAYDEGEMNGKEIGKIEEKKAIAKAMLKKYSIDEIMSITGLSEKEIALLKEEN